MSEGLQRALAMYADIKDEWRREDTMAVQADAVIEKSYIRGSTVVVCGRFGPIGFYDTVRGIGVFSPRNTWRAAQALRMMEYIDTHDPDTAGRIGLIDVLAVLLAEEATTMALGDRVRTTVGTDAE